jgi:putative ABC transport system permease protein
VDRAGRKGALKTAAAGLGAAGAGVLFLLLFPGRVYLGFGGSLAVLAGISLMTGLTVTLLHRPVKLLAGRLAGLPGRVAAGNVRLNLGRTSVAVAAFMVALSMSIGMSTMIGSFRGSVSDWLDRQLPGDLYISSMDEQDVPAALYDALRALPGVAGVDPYRSTPLHFRDTLVYVSSVDAAVLQRFAAFKFASGGRENWDRVRAGDVIISESFARRFGVRTGDSLPLNAARGPVRLRVAAVFYDYTSEHGVVMMDRALYLRLFEDPLISSAGVFVEPGNPRRTEIVAAAARLASENGLPSLSRDELHANALKVFDTAFAVTRSMRALAVIVAFFGIAGAILTLFIERRREFGVYRALGFSTGQVAGITLLEGLIMGLLSFLLSLASGTVMAILLIRVINLRSFHWTIFFHPSAGPYGAAAATALAASLGAALIPIIRAWRTYPQMQIREE